jgi:tetratricopeptide (TPR) repeat protein
LSDSLNNPSKRKPAQTVFVLALIGVPALLLWMYFAPRKQGEPSFEKLQSQTMTEKKTPLEQMEDMWRHHPDHGPIALELANLYLEDGQYGKAIEFYNIFLRDDTSATGWVVRLDMSRAYSAMMMKDSAIAQLDMMLERDPSHPGALYNLGAIEANSGNLTAARKHWEQLIAKNPQDTLAQFARAALPRLTKLSEHP